MRSAYLGFLLTAWLVGTASGMAPYSLPPEQVWSRNADGEILYVADREGRLADLCVETNGVGFWVPPADLEEVRFPQINEARLVRGMGLMELHDRAPTAGMWETTVQIETLIEEERGNFKNGDTYQFLGHAFRGSRAGKARDRCAHSVESNSRLPKLRHGTKRRNPATWTQGDLAFPADSLLLPSAQHYLAMARVRPATSRSHRRNAWAAGDSARRRDEAM